MRQWIIAGLTVSLSVALWSCGPSGETGRPTGLATKESLFRAGHELYLMQEFDSALVLLKRSAACDSSYVSPLADLAALYHDLGTQQHGEKNPKRLEYFRASRSYFARMEALGMREADIYERLCELSVVLDDDRTFLKYARKNAELYPYDRQYYNLGVASFGAGEYQNVIRTQKEALQKFKQSPYLGGFYRYMGHAYMKVDRDQTAERVLTTGVQAVGARIGELKKGGGNYTMTEEFRRLNDDKIGMLLLLKRLHQVYKAGDKLEQVECQLREAGHTKQ